MFPQGAPSFLQTGRTESKNQKPTPFRDRWQISFSLLDLQQQGGEYTPVDVKNSSDPALPTSLEWHSGIVMENLSADWKVIYARGTAPVLVERQMGRGSVVILTDSYFFSNEAMRVDRHADLLSWLIGPNRRVIFDEAHLGVTETPGIATLMRRYRLHWFVSALIALTALFVWKNSVSLIPARFGPESTVYITGRDTAAGYVSLLRRGIPEQDLLSLCFSEWKTSGEATARVSSQRIQKAEQVLEAENARPAKDRNPVKAYREMAQILQAKLK
jgi:hypothetical protein